MKKYSWCRCGLRALSLNRGQHTAATPVVFSQQVFVPRVLQCAAVQSMSLSPPSPLPGGARTLQRLTETRRGSAIPSHLRPVQNRATTTRAPGKGATSTAQVNSSVLLLPVQLPKSALILHSQKQQEKAIPGRCRSTLCRLLFFFSPKLKPLWNRKGGPHVCVHFAHSRLCDL